MAALNLLLVIALVLLAGQLLTLLVNLYFFPVLSDYTEEKAIPDMAVSILIPARNEAATLPQTLPRVLAQQFNCEVWVLDDQSSDATASILKALQQTHPQLNVLTGQPLPAGWSGKNWACQQLAERATGELLVFTDADVSWEPDTLAALLAFRQAAAADFVSVWPRQLTATFWERVTVPVIDQILLGLLPYPGVRFIPSGKFSAGNGQLMCWTREAYLQVGGHAAFRAEVLEDVRMGQAAKAAGLRVGLAVGGDTIATRMYTSAGAMLEGFSKNIVAAAGSNAALVFAALLSTLIHTLSWLFALFHPWWWLVVGLSLLQRLLTNLKTGRINAKGGVADTLLQPLTSIAIWRIVWRALRSGRGYTWKGRRYSA